jgi:hypothetical protein
LGGTEAINNPTALLYGKIDSEMPTVLWIGNLRVVVYPNDHRPAHVHVIERSLLEHLAELLNAWERIHGTA